MYEVIYMKAYYEPWWMFEDWEDFVLEKKAFMQIVEAENYVKELLNKLRVTYTYEEQRKERFYAFWCPDEKVFCEGCDEDLQIFHGVFVLENGNPMALVLENNSNI